MLNILWAAFFILSAIAGLWQALVLGNGAIFQEMVTALFEMAALSVEIALGLVGLLCFWLGMMRIAEAAGIVDRMAWMLSPLFVRLMPEVPRGHPALGSICMNMMANMLGLDNAATPLGLKAMNQLQLLNPEKDRATNAQILFLVINTSSVTLLPVTIFLYRAQQGAADPASVFLPILFATSCSTLAGLLVVAWVQKLALWDRVVMAWLGGFALIVGGLAWVVSGMESEAASAFSSLLGNAVLFGVIIGFVVAGLWRRVPVYEHFVEGAKEGFQVALTIIPYLVAMLCAIGLFRASGALDGVLEAVRWLVVGLGLDGQFVDALPTALMKPFSGSGARAMMLETMQHHGVDSFPAILAAIVQGSTETTFYVLAVYFGSVGISRVRHAVGCGLVADMTGVLAAIGIGYVLLA